MEAPPSSTVAIVTDNTTTIVDNYDSEGAMEFIVATVLVYSLMGIVSMLIMRIRRRAMRGSNKSNTQSDKAVQEYLKMQEILEVEGFRYKLRCEKKKILDLRIRYEPPEEEAQTDSIIFHIPMDESSPDQTSMFYQNEASCELTSFDVRAVPPTGKSSEGPESFSHSDEISSSGTFYSDFQWSNSDIRSLQSINIPMKQAAETIELVPKKQNALEQIAVSSFAETDQRTTITLSGSDISIHNAFESANDQSVRPLIIEKLNNSESSDSYA